MVAGKGLKIDCQGHLGQVHSSKSEATVEGFFVLACLFLYSPSVWYILYKMIPNYTPAVQPLFYCIVPVICILCNKIDKMAAAEC
jgi:hypothetical protein